MRRERRMRDLFCPFLQLVICMAQHSALPEHALSKDFLSCGAVIQFVDNLLILNQPRKPSS